MSKTKALRHIELDGILDITLAFTDATRALVSDMRAKEYNPYDKWSTDPAKRPMKAAWQASCAVVHFTLYHTLPLQRSVPPFAFTSVCTTAIYECSRHTNELFTEKATVPKQSLSYGYPSETYLTYPSIL